MRYTVSNGRHADAVGDLVAWRDGNLTVRTRQADLLVPEAAIVGGKPVPEPKLVHAADVSIAQVQRISSSSWRPLESAWLGGWLLRAGAGFTGRANSVLPLGEPGLDLDDALTAVESWYGDRGIAPRFQLPLPYAETLDAALDDRGWPPGDSVDVMVADIPEAIATLQDRPDLPPVVVEPRPSPGWLSAYHYRGRSLPDSAIEVLANHDQAGFASVVESGVTVAVARGAVDADWLGIAAVEVAESARRRGLGRHVMRGLFDWAADRGARHAHLQVDVHNAAGQALYAAMAFERHHRYVYRLARSTNTLISRPARSR